MLTDQPHKIFSLLSFLFSAVALYSQDRTVIKANIDKSNIVIGEQIHLYLEADFPPHEAMSFFTIDSIPHFEILDRKKIDTVDNNEELKLSQSLTLTSFDSGHWVIPSFELPLDKPLLTDTIPVNVSFSPFDPTKDYHDIKDIINVQVAKKKKKQDWYWFAGASALLIAGMIYLLLKKKKQPVKAIVIDPYIEAKQELEKLRRENPSPKLFYTKLVDIFRVYLHGRKGLASLQETADDLIYQLRQLKLPEADHSQLAQALRTSDFVKFAKYEPSEKDKTDSFDITTKTIDTIEATTRAERKTSNT